MCAQTVVWVWEDGEYEQSAVLGVFSSPDQLLTSLRARFPNEQFSISHVSGPCLSIRGSDGKEIASIEAFRLDEPAPSEWRYTDEAQTFVKSFATAPQTQE